MTYCPAQYATHDERLAALKVGANLIRSRLPHMKAICLVGINQHRVECHVEWRWPGVVLVTTRRTAVLVAASKPGKPYELAEGDAIQEA